MNTNSGIFAPLTQPPAWTDRPQSPVIIDLDRSEWIVLPPAHIAADAMAGADQ